MLPDIKNDQCSIPIHCEVLFCSLCSFFSWVMQPITILDHKLLLLWINLFFLFNNFCWASREYNSTWNVIRTKEIFLPQSLKDHLSLLDLYSLSFPFSTSLSFSLTCRIIYCCCYCSVTKLCLNPCDPMDCSTPGSPVLHYLSEFAQIHVHWIDDAI